MTDSGSGATAYYLTDGLGSTAQLADATGAVTDGYTYDAFGALRTSTGATANDFRFTGQQQDAGAAGGCITCWRGRTTRRWGGSCSGI
jgi:hypothetical protein